MAECPKLVDCLFFNDKLAEMPTMSNVYKKKYCRDDFRDCARYMVSERLGKDRVPSDLFPNMRAKADELLMTG